MQKGFACSKTYTHATGLSCVFRQHRATSHCRFLHGYALQVKMVFVCDERDENGWVFDFGSLKPVKTWLEATFDHRTLVAADDPMINYYTGLAGAGLIQLTRVEHTGCEAFAELIFDYVDRFIGYMHELKSRNVRISSVEVREHETNGAICYRKSDD